MIVFPNCKINLGLHILRKREDGFHDLETVFYPIPITDALEIIPQTVTVSKDVTFSLSGDAIDMPDEDNICVKAYHLLKADFPELPAAQMHLHKTIPSGAGLGGGSADAAFTLKLLSQKFNLALTEQQLLEYASTLGSDCAFFIKNKPCFATGRGEILEEIALDLSAYKMVLINPAIHVSTAWAFSQLTPKSNRISLKELMQSPITSWRNKLTNDFEVPIFEKHPEIGFIKGELYKEGAIYAAMSGSGSSVYGLFEKSATPFLTFPPHYFYKELDLS